jgi:hypothetical protein
MKEPVKRDGQTVGDYPKRIDKMLEWWQSSFKFIP